MPGATGIRGVLTHSRSRSITFVHADDAAIADHVGAENGSELALGSTRSRRQSPRQRFMNRILPTLEAK